MKIAITGGTGFLGRYIIQQLASAGHQLRCWHRPGSDLSGLEPYQDRIQWQVGQLDDPEATEDLVQGMDAVVHSALYRPDRSSFLAGAKRSPIEFLLKNFMGSVRLFEAAHQANVSRFVFISTCAVHEVILEDRPLDEAHPLWATTHYGAHKAALEKLVHSYGLGSEWPICALRPTGIYGTAHPPDHSKWFDLVGRVIRGDAVESKRGGKEVHAADVAKATETLLGAPADAIQGQSFNCYDMYISEEHVARLAKEISGSNSDISDLNRGPKHQIETGKIRNLGMQFGGESLLRSTVEELVRAHQEGSR